MSEPKAALKTELGVDVVAQEARVPDGSVREAVNVELNEKSGFRRRPGYATFLAGLSSGLYTPANMPQLAIYLDRASRELRRIDGAGYVTLAHDADDLWPIEHAHYLYVGIGSRVVRIDPDFSCRTAGIANLIGLAPSLAQLTPLPAGGLAVGTYLVAVSYHNDLGEESGLTNTAKITLGAGFGAIEVDLPPPPDEAVTMSIYRTRTNGRVLRRVTTVQADTTFTISLGPLGRPARTWLRCPLPSGMLSSYQGRLYSAWGTFLYFTDPLNTNLMDARSGFIPFGERLCGVAAVANGLFVGTDSNVYFLWGGGPTEFQIRLVADNGMIFGSAKPLSSTLFPEEMLRGAIRLPGGAEAEAVAVWLSPFGVQMGLVGGAVLTPQEGRVSLACERASLTGFKRAGIHQLLIATEGLELGVGGSV